MCRNNKHSGFKSLGVWNNLQKYMKKKEERGQKSIWTDGTERVISLKKMLIISSYWNK